MPGEHRVGGLGVSPGIARGPLVSLTLAVPTLPDLDDPHTAVHDAAVHGRTRGD